MSKPVPPIRPLKATPFFGFGAASAGPDWGREDANFSDRGGVEFSFYVFLGIDIKSALQYSILV
jgi:hypothetical protein